MSRKMNVSLPIVIMLMGVCYCVGYLAKKNDIEQENRKRKTAERRGRKVNMVLEPTEHIKEALEKTEYEPHKYESMEDIPLPKFLRKVDKHED